ncbi:hypothetical protein A2642_04310 [Candidatus Nomurabacteria bacterium RIFCSPHIGHO2_01_FULL_39_10]|nr:MAG: hypothetical protein A2642_04310 [Candidatus Nomurabacteria bacterium RIFCSPHIGHO2_01_FULL_39_10]
MNQEIPKSKNPEGGGAAKIQAKIESVLKEAELEKTFKVIVRLEQGVKNMVMPERFSNINIVSNRPYTVSGEPMTQEGLTEAEAKRAELLIDLKTLKKKIEDAQQGLIDVTTEIAATELPGGWLG